MYKILWINGQVFSNFLFDCPKAARDWVKALGVEAKIFGPDGSEIDHIIPQFNKISGDFIKSNLHPVGETL